MDCGAAGGQRHFSIKLLSQHKFLLKMACEHCNSDVMMRGKSSRDFAFMC